MPRAKKGAQEQLEPGTLVPVTSPEVRRLLLAMVMSHGHEEEVAFALGWSVWRRRHQARAKRCHYKRRIAKLSLSVPPGPS